MVLCADANISEGNAASLFRVDVRRVLAAVLEARSDHEILAPSYASPPDQTITCSRALAESARRVAVSLGPVASSGEW
jgi:hypothetical protein